MAFSSRARRAIAHMAALVLSGLLVAATGEASKHVAPIPAATLVLMAGRNGTAAAPILIRTFKKRGRTRCLEADRKRSLRASEDVSGQLGPKLKEGDRQTPEGFYSVTPQQLNPNSAYHLSFYIGFPNAYDKAHGATGSHLMVHGASTSAGRYAMTDQAVEETYAIAREAFAGGQKAFQFQALPFRMPAQNMVAYRSDPNIAFWRQLKEGSDRFEATGEEPTISVSEKRYVFAPSKNPEREARAVARHSEEEACIASLTEAGTIARANHLCGRRPAPLICSSYSQGASVGLLSRPEALAFAPREVSSRQRAPCGMG
jgi:murein L,D-transpeptidase YafK